MNVSDYDVWLCQMMLFKNFHWFKQSKKSSVQWGPSKTDTIRMVFHIQGFLNGQFKTCNIMPLLYFCMGRSKGSTFYNYRIVNYRTVVV